MDYGLTTLATAVYVSSGLSWGVRFTWWPPR